ncbi:MAG: sulfotransferase family 2 domain-containing protein [Pseudoruegeria sp.]
MLIGVKNRFLFVSNSKTASTSIETALRAHCEIQRDGTPHRKHMQYADILGEYDFLFGQETYRPNQFFKFAVMRDPIDWIYSWYRYRKGNQVAAPLPSEMTFAEFWDRKDWNIHRADGSKHLQKHFFTDATGEVALDYIIPYDDLPKQFAVIANHLGLPSKLPRANVSQIKGTPTELSEGLLDEMRSFYAEDYDLYHALPTRNEAGLNMLKSA